MKTALDIAKKYFELSNKHDLNGIAGMFTNSSTYSSLNAGVYLGEKQIMSMMRPFHESFNKLSWDVKVVEEIRPGVVWFDFVMSGTKKTGESIKVAGEEYVIVKDGKLQHVEVRNK